MFKQLSDLLDTGVEKGVLNTKVAEYLMVNSPIVPIFRHIPKLHKNMTPGQGRPIVAGIGSLFEKLGHWIDQYLQPLVTRLPGYIKDTKSVLTHIQEVEWKNGYQWLTIDVKSLYSCIPHDLAIKALQYHLTQYSIYDTGFKEFLVMAVDFLTSTVLCSIGYFPRSVRGPRWELVFRHCW